MEVQLIRTYHPDGVNGVLYFQGKELCRTIELPWQDNQPRVSCIPEGSYKLRKRQSPRFHLHFEVMGVPQRSYILFHAANEAKKELRGCIAPVLTHTGAGKGSGSRASLERMKERLYPILDSGLELLLIIKKEKS
ncbi:DUF5675 family protein [Kaistella palustris]|uniref:DUF5675 family protein n=1 Tax=Kaistella palustris TaxID=493376 RepID=UPI000417DCEA|nr:DUF5675 family protein [Kaistella palustris]